MALRLDITDPDQCDQAVACVVADHGTIDVLVNNAGVASAIPVLQETPQDFRSVVETNLFGITYWMSQACARIMPRGSAIVNVGSVLASTAMMSLWWSQPGSDPGFHRPRALRLICRPSAVATTALPTERAVT